MANNDIKIKILALDLASGEIKKVGQSAERLRDVFGQVGRESGGVSASFSSMATVMGAVGSAVAGIGLAQLAGEFVRLADNARLMEGRLKLVTKSSAELSEVQQGLYAISQESRGSYESTVELYTRLARSAQSLGLSQGQLLTVIELINKAVMVSGTSASVIE